SAASTLAQYENDYNTIRDQINDLVEDAGYRGVNLINGDTLETYFNEDRSNKLSTVGQTLDSDGLGLAAADFSTLETIETTTNEARAGLATLRSFGGTLANSLSVIQTRETFTKSLVETLNEGSDKLTIADQNEEGAKLLALQTRQQLGVTALSLAAQAQQSVLRLF
ncbi:MAG TPA: flagellin, partial [Alphaproteobacteria bacterium]